MRITVAPRALPGRGSEVHMLQTCLQCGPAMAIAAGHRPMCAEQRKPRPRVIETSQFFPLNRRVAGLASEGRTIRALCCHLLLKLS